ncbi:NAD(P)H-dependent oxidoreductase [Paraburkholderia sprentiae WSM5005]|uniref:NAD(P)H-dependent oxidoreductase n=1 Tax=Paraburkholderia sprentiae WSM5005 TaxID=754502 RepID=A0A1I9YSW2_9BURK|nr:NAD(P)H-dependent oxidoreductase [Paraburkholderia sprentiae WSM5005]
MTLQSPGRSDGSIDGRARAWLALHAFRLNRAVHRAVNRNRRSISLSRSDHRPPPLVVGIGGTTRAISSTECALALALRGAEAAGAHTRLFGGTFLHSLPHYAPEQPARTDEQLQLIEAVRRADAVIIATPGYHGGVSGLVKNALDTLEELRADERPYLDGRAVGCIVTAYGWQATGSVLTSLRSIVHALRGWPTPFGAGINTLETRFDSADSCSDPKVVEQLATVGQQTATFALAFDAQRAHGAPAAASRSAASLASARSTTTPVAADTRPTRVLHAV